MTDLTGVRQHPAGNRSGQFDIAGKEYSARGRFCLESSTILLDISTIWVPSTLKRKGLGTAFLVSIEQAASTIQPLISTQNTERTINIEGYFCDEGIGFASASCHQLPKPGQPSQLLAEYSQQIHHHFAR
ncbi:hypothetical protein N5C43_11065 [Comamonas terrigena]|uniref:hypothetical protein n=1 Tax=Comamonas terrigena TaxID=32013 RepID=UPI00244AF256|nr:hypothetical protein [Comamonas terrigena]MDH1291797.1 hypothetical protein [Comamonas terrigena]